MHIRRKKNTLIRAGIRLLIIGAIVHTQLALSV